VVDSDDWRVHKQIRYLAADICLEYGLNLSPRVWSTSHHGEVEELQPLLYHNIRRDSINLLDLLCNRLMDNNPPLPLPFPLGSSQERL